MRRGDDLRGQGEVAPQILDALGGEVAVVVLPAEGKADESARLQGFHEVQHLEVGASLDVGVGRADGVLLDDEDALAEEVSEDGYAVGLGDEHGVGWSGRRVKGVGYECRLDRIFNLKHEKL